MYPLFRFQNTPSPLLGRAVLGLLTSTCSFTFRFPENAQVRSYSLLFGGLDRSGLDLEILLLVVLAWLILRRNFTREISSGLVEMFEYRARIQTGTTMECSRRNRVFHCGLTRCRRRATRSSSVGPQPTPRPV